MVLFTKTYNSVDADTTNMVSVDITGTIGTVSGINLDCPHIDDRRRGRWGIAFYSRTLVKDHLGIETTLL